jgi:hypothetical protein
VNAVTTTGVATSIQLNCADAASAALSYVLDTQPVHGTLGQINQATGQVTYTPGAGYSGADRFTYHATSANGTAAAKTVKITVNPLGQITSSLTWSFMPQGRSVAVTSLAAHQLPIGASVVILCSGRGCPFSKRTTVARAPKCKRHKRCVRPRTRDLSLASQFRGRHLAFGTQLTIRFVKAGFIGKVYAFKISKAVPVKISCLAPGGIQPGKGC